METLFEYDIFVPKVSNTGAPFPEEVFSSFKSRIVEIFGGLTESKFQNEGIWKIANVSLRDEIIIWKVIGQPTSTLDKTIQNLKQELEKALDQDEILIIRRDIKKFRNEPK